MAKKWTKLVGSITLAGALLLTATACSDNSSSDTKSSQSSPSSSASNKSSAKKTASTAVKTAQIKLSQTDAINKFHEKYKGKEVKEISLEKENGSYVYNIDGFDKTHEYEVKVNATSGKILSNKTEKADLDEMNEKALDVDNLISRNEATKIAEKKVSGTADKWDLKQSGKNTIWEIEVVDGTTKHEVQINAKTKEVLKVEKEN
ncbi:hypothetical protein FP435_07570 [Lactobacillus sp. PV037]|uniref:PepSY domain-containing protein n=1 Tax=Lactobacillus sp. PV037 TaxID=2594496 RepID=UPI00223F5186|nr:PepSY domain-containing protein [Lactobacillus sp. PV037]QNQ84285.1 hypothetical protein FP435_07570 [Lactobacillus sp. PV037]